MNREMLGDLLEDEYDILYASDGVEALEILRSYKNEIALVLLDLYMPNMSGKDVMAQMQVDEELMSIPVIFISVDEKAELECLKMGAMDFIPKPDPDIDIIKARISRCIELAENRDLIRSTQRDKLTGLFNIDYFIWYVKRYDLHFRETAFDAVAINVNKFHEVQEQYGRQFGSLVLRSVGISLSKYARKAGGIGCRIEEGAFLFYSPHQDDFEKLIDQFISEVFIEKETSSKVNLKFGIYANAQHEPDIEERFVRAKAAADSVENDLDRIYGVYEFS